MVGEPRADRRAPGSGCRLGGLVATALLLAPPLPPGQEEGAESPPAAVPAEEDPLAPGPPAPIAHLGGFLATSRLVREAEPDRPVERRAVYAFPDRARATIQPLGGPAASREETFRFGGHVWRYAARAGRAVELAGAERTEALLGLELFRAAFLWPEGFVWEEVEVAGEEGRRELRAAVRAAAAGGPQPIGTLAASLDAEGRPGRISARDGEGTERHALVVIGWQSGGGSRLVPGELELFQNGVRVGRETVTLFSTRAIHMDRFFQPPDRAPEGDLSRPQIGIRTVELTPMVFLAHPLAAGTSWEEALARFQALRATAAEELKSSGLVLEETPTFALEERTGSPARVLLTLAAPHPATLPAGWSVRVGGPGLLEALAGPAEVNAARLARLFAAVPEGMRGGEAYVRIWPKRVQLTLPLEARRDG
ncbi:MAG: hypothetical protein AB1726_07965 [Planctomycetota bacterium]